MKISVNIPDSTYQKYLLLHKAKTEEEVKSLIQARLATWADKLVLADPSDRTFFITGDERRAMEAVIGTTVDSAADLIKRLHALSAVKVGVLEYHLSPGESIRLTEQAKFHGWTPDAFFQNTCQEIFDRFMERI